MTSEAVLVPMSAAESISDEIEKMYDQITRRANEIFLERGGICSVDLEDWLTAERELLQKPDVFIEEKSHEIRVTVCLGAVNLTDLRLLVTPLVVLVQAERGRAARRLFRAIKFPRRIDVNKAEAKYEDGCLVLTA